MLNSPLSTRPVIEALEARIAPATFTVTTTADSGPGSLRQAILDANALTGADSIGFEIPGDQLQVIALTSALPAITDKVTISGTQAPGSTEKIRLDGTSAGPDASGLRIMTDAASGTIINNLQIANFSGSGVFVDGTLGVEISNNQIFGNGLHGVHIKGGSGGKVYGNYLGAPPNIQNSTGNRGDGLLIENSTSNLIGLSMFDAWLSQGNTVRANGLFGIEVRGGSDNTIARNTVTENGSLAPDTDQGGGIAVIDSQSAHVGRAIPIYNVGYRVWDTTVLGNKISANIGNGVLIQGSNSVGTGIAGNEITGNLLGNGVKIDAAVNTRLSDSEYATGSHGTSGRMKGNTISENAGWGIAVVNGASSTDVRTNAIAGNGAGAIFLDHAVIIDDGSPAISIQDVLTAEDADPGSLQNGYSTARYTVTLSNPSLDPVTVYLSVAGGTATLNSDYSLANHTITFAPGTTSVTGSFTIKNDTIGEETETIQLQLSNPNAATLERANAVVSILDNDMWVIQTEPVQVVEGNDGQNMAVMKVRLVTSYGVTDHPHAISATFKTLDYEARAGSDYIATEGTLTFQPGEFEKTISIPIFGDRTVESDEAFMVAFPSYFGATLQQPSQRVTILNDDPGVISVAPASIVEGNNGQKLPAFNVSLSVPIPVAISFGFATQGNSAFEGVDFEPVSGQLTFAPGETQKTISVPIYGDRTVEQDETFTLKLTDGSGATVATTTGTIRNDDPVISIENLQIPEGQPATPGTRSVYLPVHLSQATDVPVTVDFATSNGTAEAPSDYIATSGTLTFAPGQTLKYIELQIMGDLTLEPDESFTVKLSNAQGAPLDTDTGVVTIKADEPFISAQNVTIIEGHSGTKSMLFTVILSQPQSSAVTVNYAAADGTATAGSDYTAVSGTLTFAPGETTKTISVPIIGDVAHEADETLRLLLSEASGVTLAQNDATGTILNDDLSLDAVHLVISKGGRKATWIDSDGDQVTLTATRPVLALSSFHFASAPEGDGLVLEQLDAAGQGSGASGALGLSFLVKKSATGDGLLHVGAIDATGHDLSTLSLPGRLGRISAGDANLKTPAIGKLTVDFFGLDSATAQAGDAPLLSEIKGSIGSLVVKHDLTGANLMVSGGSVGSLVIGGSLEGTSAAAPTGISTEKNLGTLRVGGDVNHANVIAGSGSQAGAHVEQVLVGGDWIASNLVVGAGAGPDGLYGTGDDEALQDSASRIARITIHGAVVGTAEAENGSDHFGFVAGRIAAFQVGVQKLALTSRWQDSVELGSTSDVMLLELAGRSRA